MPKRSPTPELRLGQPVVASAWASREPVGDSGFEWVRRPLTVPVRGFVVGLRTKQSGEIVAESEGDEFGYEHATWNTWRRMGSYPVVLVATDLRRNHLICPVEDVEVLDAKA